MSVPQQPAQVPDDDTMEAALGVACPVCRAEPGQPCRGRRLPPGGIHRRRVEVAAPKDQGPIAAIETLVLLCQRCGHEITAHAPGYATADRRAAFLRGVALKRWRRDNPDEDMRDGPAPVPWRLVHLACDVQRCEDDTRIDARQLRTPRRLARVSVRLTGKLWVPHTDWAGLVKHIERASAEPQVAEDAAQRRAEAAKRAGLQEDWEN